MLHNPEGGTQGQCMSLLPSSTCFYKHWPLSRALWTMNIQWKHQLLHTTKLIEGLLKNLIAEIQAERASSSCLKCTTAPCHLTERCGINMALLEPQLADNMTTWLTNSASSASSALHISFNTPSWLAILSTWAVPKYRFETIDLVILVKFQSPILKVIKFWATWNCDGFLVSIGAPPCPPPLTLVHLVPSRILVKSFEHFSPI